MTDPDEEFWNIAIMSVLADIRSDINAMLLGVPAADAEEDPDE